MPTLKNISGFAVCSLLASAAMIVGALAIWLTSVALKAALEALFTCGG